MPNPEHYSERTFSRRDILKYGSKVAIATTGAVILNGAMPKIVEAFTAETDPLPRYNNPPWSPKYWYSEARLSGQPALADLEIDGYVNGLRFHDYLAGTLDLPREQGSAFAFEQWYNEIMLKSFPQEIGWLGKCAPSQMAAMLDEEPTEKSFYVDGLGWVGRPTMESFYTAFRQATPTVPAPRDNRGRLNYDFLASWLTDGRPLLANRAVGTGEKWFSAIWGYDNGYTFYYPAGSQSRAIAIAVNGLEEVYTVYDHDAPIRDESLAEASKSWANPNLQYQIAREATELYKSS